MRRLLWLAAIVAVGPFAAHAAPGEGPREQRNSLKPTSIYVDYTGDDEAGAVFNYQLKEAFRASRGLPLGDSESATYEIHLVSVDSASPPKGLGSTVAIVLVTNSSPAIFIAQWSVSVGRDAAVRVAPRIVAGVDKSIQDFAPRVPSMLKDLCGSR